MREEMEERIIEEIGQESQSEQASQSEIVETQKETVSEADNKEKNNYNITLYSFNALLLY